MELCSLLRESTPSSMAASRFKYNTKQMSWGEFSLAQWFLYWLSVQGSLVQILSRPYIFAMHFFICFFFTDFVRRITIRLRQIVEGDNSVHFCKNHAPFFTKFFSTIQHLQSSVAPACGALVLKHR